MKKLVILLAGLLVLLVACRSEKIVQSEVLSEPAEVVDLVYTPSQHGRGSGSSVGITTGGDLSIGSASVVVDVPEVYAIVFRCQHGKFIFQSRQDKAKELWHRLKEGQQVTVTYRNVYKYVYEDDNLVEKHLAKYSFIDAQ